MLLAEKMGFEPMLRLSHTTPLAGEPLEPLGYFSKSLKLLKLDIKFYSRSTAKGTEAGGRRVKQIVWQTICSQSREQALLGVGP